MTREFQHRSRLDPDRSDSPGAQLRLDVDYVHGAIKIDGINGKSHAQSMNAVAGNDPEAITVTEVTRGHPQQATEPRPMRVGYSQSGGEVHLSGPVKGLSLRGENRHGL